MPMIAQPFCDLPVVASCISICSEFPACFADVNVSNSNGISIGVMLIRFSAQPKALVALGRAEELGYTPVLDMDFPRF